MEVMEDKKKPSEQYYDYLKSQGLDVPPTYQSFEKTLQDEGSRKQYYSYLEGKKKELPDLDIAPSYDSFSSTLGAKKKSGWLNRLIRSIRAAYTAFKTEFFS